MAVINIKHGLVESSDHSTREKESRTIHWFNHDSVPAQVVFRKDCPLLRRDNKNTPVQPGEAIDVPAGKASDIFVIAFGTRRQDGYGYGLTFLGKDGDFKPHGPEQTEPEIIVEAGP